ncbi:hypothetical protein BCR24_07630 [Enterococcus ureilyticus]|uniref:Uncharacterized protein n=1 Tax=Enterococcus ureilyticus TaxID=1131292 RepID=A0A1E5H8N7_9ENTE|nr:hypothetical protein [Enterococcus ureilyticus]MBM7687494.1 hypothetical protein [Enterococcus ureilyticus]MBO0445145.1 hypothetical protein [Enterococcus ureilyticus]OEG21329.1 hypothetical protein BCR24_07630 [Enterococcus ureilyticus]
MEETTNKEKNSTKKTVNIKLRFSKKEKIVNQKWYKIIRVKNALKNFFKSIFSRLLTIIITLIVAVPMTYNIQELMKTEKEKIDYKVDFDAKYITSNQIQFEKGYEGEYQYSFGLTLTLNINSGTLQHLYLIYTNHDNEPITSTDFHKLNFNLQSNLNLYNLLSIAVSGVNNRRLSNAEIITELNYSSQDNEKIKDIYLLTIDKQSNPSIVLLTVQGTPISRQESGSEHSIVGSINPKPFYSPVVFEQINSFDFLDKEVPQNITESFVKNKGQILSIYSDFTSFK